MAKSRVTLADVADRAGVTKSTVSKILSGQGTYPDATRERVKAVAAELRYMPSAMARALRTGKSRTVGLVTSDQLGRFSIPVLHGAEEYLRERGVSILLGDARGDAELEQQYAQTLADREVEGIIVVGHRSDPREPIKADPTIPVVYAYSASRRQRDRSVIPDDHHGGRLAGEHLRQIGCARIAYVGGPEDYAACHIRLAGLREGAGSVPVDTVTFEPWSEAGGRHAGAQLLDTAGSFPIGVFCANDQLARGVLTAALTHGLRIPQDVRIVGFDDWQDMTLATEPELSSVYMDLHTVGMHAADILINNKAVSSAVSVPCSLAVRGSSKR